MNLSVVIVAWNSAEYLARTLPALDRELLEGDEVIIVDNGSSDDLAGVTSTSCPRATIVAMGTNAGYTAGVNHGAGVASNELLVILNPDGQEVARLIGDAEWDSPSAIAVLKALVEGP